jgi:hypothetical protein
MNEPVDRYVRRVTDETPEQRRQRFRDGNNAVWGVGQWVECNLPCCLDGEGKPSFHHRRYHEADR